MKFGVVLVCHPSYHRWLANAILSIERQGFDEKVLVYDLAGLQQFHSPDLPEGWKLRVGNWASPNPARNAGFDEISTQWVCFWDADNVMHETYLGAAQRVANQVASNVAVCYPDVQEINPDGSLGLFRKMPKWSLNGAQARNLADTGSFWRASALREVGGFSKSQVRHDDFDLALRLFRAGWQGQRIATAIRHLAHPESRSATCDLGKSLWHAWSYAFVTLWSGASQSRRVLDWLATAKIPPQSSLYWVDNSGTGAFNASLISEYQRRLSSRFQGLTLRTMGSPYQAAPGEDYLHLPRHQHVSALYNEILPRIREEVVIFLEDDVVPPKDGLCTLLQPLIPGTEVVMVAGVYQSRRTPTVICASRRFDRWGDAPRWDSLPTKPFPVGMSGGGFTAVGNWALRGALPMRTELDARGSLIGWDGNLGMHLTNQGYTLLAHPGVRCEHVCPEVLAYNARSASVETGPRSQIESHFAS